jgi:hypothetical protein
MKRFVTANLANSPKAWNNTDTIRNITLSFVPILFKLNLDSLFGYKIFNYKNSKNLDRS